MNIFKYWRLTIISIQLLYLPANRVKYLLTLLMALLVFEVAVKGQGNSIVSYPKKGRLIPDYRFSDVKYYNRDTVSISDFTGKWLILDFWSRFCASCIVDMPDLNAIQKDLGSNVQVLLVGLNSTKIWTADAHAHPGRNGDYMIRTLYDQIRKRDSLNLPVAWDTTLYARFLGQGLPYTIIVNPEGIVQAITSGIKKSQMEALIRGDRPPIYPYILDTEKVGKRRYDWDLPYLTNGDMANGGSDTGFMFRDILGKVDPGVLYEESFRFRGGTFDVSHKPLAFLYKIAFLGADYWDFTDTLRYGKFVARPVFWTPDSSELLEGQRYSYSLTLYKSGDKKYSKGTPIDVRKLEIFLKRDLELNFHYRAELVDTAVTVYRLVVKDKAKVTGLATKGGARHWVITPERIDLMNVPMNEFASRVLLRTRQHEVYVENGTGISGNIDLVIDGLTGEFDHVNASLDRVGLQLIPELRTMKALVISDQSDKKDF